MFDVQGNPHNICHMRNSKKLSYKFGFLSVASENTKCSHMRTLGNNRQKGSGKTHLDSDSWDTVSGNYTAIAQQAKTLVQHHCVSRRNLGKKPVEDGAYEDLRERRELGKGVLLISVCTHGSPGHCRGVPAWNRPKDTVEVLKM